MLLLIRKYIILIGLVLMMAGCTNIDSSTGSHMFNKIDHAIYFVNDLPRAKKFYADTLRLPVVIDSPGFVSVKVNENWIGLKPTEMKGKDVGKGPMVYLNVNDLKETLVELKKRGVKIHVDITKVPTGMIATIHDSEGNAIGLYETKDR